jgi:hypothetical protein
MAKDSSIKEFLFSVKKKIKSNFSLGSRKLNRLFLSNTLSEIDSYKVPIIINNRNRYTYLLQLINWLENNNYKNIIILDNDSTFPELLEYYKITKHRVVYLNANVGYMALWQTPIFNEFKKDFYVYTDPDVIPGESCPQNIVFKMYEILKKYNSIEKLGVALRIDDLPDHYKNKAAVIMDEKRFWKTQISQNVYNAPVDTTFSLYKPLAYGNSEQCVAYRLAGNYTFRHLPWYEDSLNPTSENKYYIDHVKKGSTVWSVQN